MRIPRVRFTIRSLMIAVMIAAGLLALPVQLSAMLVGPLLFGIAYMGLLHLLELWVDSSHRKV